MKDKQQKNAILKPDHLQEASFLFDQMNNKELSQCSEILEKEIRLSNTAIKEGLEKDKTKKSKEETKTELSKIQLSVGACPICGKKDHWLNDVPLRAFCWGTEDKPHKEWSKIIPKEYNPYKVK